MTTIIFLALALTLPEMEITVPDDFDHVGQQVIRAHAGQPAPELADWAAHPVQNNDFFHNISRQMGETG